MRKLGIRMDWTTEYRERAGELREMAEDFSDERLQRKLLKAADDYDRLADQRDRKAGAYRGQPCM